eukprot:gene12518-20431_t
MTAPRLLLRGEQSRPAAAAAVRAAVRRAFEARWERAA